MNLSERTSIFMENAISSHGTKYDYSRVQYINAHTKVEIICKHHGSFYQVPNNHTSLKQGCPLCETIAKSERNKLTLHEFIAQAKAVHGDKYDYTESRYISSTQPIQIRCNEHGIFKVARAEKHILGQRCPKCRKGSAAEERIKNILLSHNIEFETQQKFTDCVSHVSGVKLSFDFYLPKYNVLIEYDGEQHYKKSPLFHTGDRFERLQQHDTIKTEYANQHGYILIRIPYKSFNDLEQILTKIF